MSATVRAVIVGGNAHGESWELEAFRWSIESIEYRRFPEEPVRRTLELRQVRLGRWVHNVLVEAKDAFDSELIEDALLSRLHSETGLGQSLYEEAA